MLVSLSATVLDQAGLLPAGLHLEHDIIASRYLQLGAHEFIQCHHQRTVLLVNLLDINTHFLYYLVKMPIPTCLAGGIRPCFYHRMDFLYN
jgi:hypothetical protein